MRWWKRRKKHQLRVDAVFRKMTSAAFPGGDNQIAEEAAEVAVLLQNRVSYTRAKEILIHSKGLILIALRSASDDIQAVSRCAHSMQKRWSKELDQSTAEQIASFAYRRLVGDLRQSRQDRITSLSDMTKEEALLVARITAYRLARHIGRTDAQVRHVYDLDPSLCIADIAQHFLTHEFEGRPKKIDTQRDALNLCIDVASMLVLACHVEGDNADPAPDPKEIELLARKELALTLSLVRDADDIVSYQEFDPSEARAANDLQVPFAVALRLGEVGLLKDAPGPTESRRKNLTDTLRRLQDV